MHPHGALFSFALLLQTLPRMLAKIPTNYLYVNDDGGVLWHYQNCLFNIVLQPKKVTENFPSYFYERACMRLVTVSSVVFHGVN